MNDRFKFRAYDTLEEQYLYDVQDMYDNEVECFGYMLDDTYKGRYIVEQCTGLKDKNGKLIYEGDIVKLSSDREVVCPVVWDNEETGFCVKHKEELYRFNTYKKYHLIEIIGNINENKELC